MRVVLLIIICLLFHLSSCLPNIADKKIYIKCLQIDSANRIDWYITSLIGGFSRSTILLATKSKEEVIIKSHGITNINIDRGKRLLFIESTDELENFGDTDSLNFGTDYKAIFNTKGFYMNDAESRYSRLQIQKINSSVPHNVNSDF